MTISGQQVFSDELVRVTRFGGRSPDLGLTVVELTGDPVASMRRLGALHYKGMGNLDPAAMDAWRNKISEKIRRHVPLLQRRAARAAAKRFVRGRSLDRVPEWKEWVAYGEGLKLSEDELFQMMWTPDFGAYASGGALAKGPGLDNGFSDWSGGCTSVARRFSDGIAWGRNLDFEGVGTFDRHPMLVIHKPDGADGAWQRMGFASEGLPLSGVTGINRYGVYVALHQHYTLLHEEAGLPAILAGERLLREADSVAAVRALLGEPGNRSAGMWSFAVGSLEDPAFTVFECWQGGAFENEMAGDRMAWTNVAQCPAVQQAQRLTWGTYTNARRRIRMSERMAGAITSDQDALDEIRRILAFQSNAAGELSTDRDILKGETIQSVAFASRGGEWSCLMGIGQAPVGSGAAYRFDVRAMAENPGSCEIERVPALVSDAVRETQFQATEAYRLSSDLNVVDEGYFQVWEHEDPCARLFQAVALVAMPDLYPRKLADLAKMPVTGASGGSQDIPSTDAIRYMAALARWRVDGRKAGQNALEAFLAGEIEDATAKDQAEEALSAAKRSLGRFPVPRFNFFSGGLA